MAGVALLAAALAESPFREGSPDIGYTAAVYAEALLDVPTLQPGLPAGAAAAVNTLATYVNLDGLALPPIEQETVVCGATTAVGCYDGTRITLVPRLSDAQAYYVTLHELLHWGKFGDPRFEATARAVWRAEHTDRSAPIFYTAGQPHHGHWDTTAVSGRHTASHMPAKAELMDPEISFSSLERGVSAYLSAASLAACGRFEGRALWCTSDADCAAPATCVAVGKLMPRRCSTTGQRMTPDDIALDRAAIMGYTALGAIGAIVATLGVSSVAGW